MNRMPIPDQHDRTGNGTEQMLQESNDFLSGDRCVRRVQVQPDLAFPRTDAQSTDQVHAFVVFETRANRRRLPTRGPRPFERRHHRVPTFIRKNQSCAEFTPLFLSRAKHSVSSGQSLRHRARDCAVAASGSSSPGAARGTTRCSLDSAPERAPRSNGQSDPVSSNLRHTRMHRHRGSGPAASGAVGLSINDWGARGRVPNLALGLATLSVSLPAAHTLCRHSHLLGHLNGRLSMSRQTKRTASTPRQLLGRTVWSHVLTNVLERQMRTLIIESSVSRARREHTVTFGRILHVHCALCRALLYLAALFLHSFDC